MNGYNIDAAQGHFYRPSAVSLMHTAEKKARKAHHAEMYGTQRESAAVLKRRRRIQAGATWGDIDSTMGGLR